MNDSKYLCKICDRYFKNLKGVSVHICQNHKENLKKYYDFYIKTITEGYCHNEKCSNETTFYNLDIGYSKYCSLICANTSAVRREQEKIRNLEKYKDPKEREKTSILVKKSYEDPNKRKNISDGLKRAFKNDPSIAKKISIKNKEFWNRPENKIKASEHTKRLWKNENIRSQMITSLRKTWSTEEYKEKKRKIALEIAKDPQWRKNVCEGTKKGWEKVPEKKKSHSLRMQNGGAAYCNIFIQNPSKPQIELFNLISKVFPYPVMNYPCGRYSIDIAVPSLNLAFEYDGSYWHQNESYDNIRQKFIEDNGWRVIRYEDRIPNISEIKELTL